VAEKGRLPPGDRPVARRQDEQAPRAERRAGASFGYAADRGQHQHISVARTLLKVGPVRRLLADRGYDANHLRRFLAEQQAEAVIPSTTSRRKPIPYDTVAYRHRNRIERMWCRLKDWLRLATRYDKLARNYLSGAYLAAIFSCWANRVRTLGGLPLAQFNFVAVG
jgi:transposase